MYGKYGKLVIWFFTITIPIVGLVHCIDTSLLEVSCDEGNKDLCPKAGSVSDE